MTVTDTEAPAEASSSAAHELRLPAPRPATGFAALVGTSDHKAVGRLWIATSLLFLLVAGIAGGLGSVERIDLEGLDVLDADAVTQTLSLHAVAGSFLFLLPLLLGVGTYVVPLQVGAATLAFPRAAAAAYWTYLVSGITVIAAFLADGGPGGSDLEAVDLFLAAMVVLLVSLTIAAVCVATTGLGLRAPGMGMHRTPLFTWANVVVAGLWVLTLPVLAGILVLSYVDLRYGPTFLGGAGGQGTEQVLVRIAWAWSQPSVYVFAVPVLGIIGDIVPVGARTRITRHRVAMGCIGAFAAFSFGAWAMPGFTPENSGDLPVEFVGTAAFVAFSFLVVLPLLAFAGLLADTLRRGAPRLLSPLVWATGSLLMLLAGAANGALVSIEPLDLIGTTATTAQIHYVLGAVLLGLFGGLAHWAPKIWGRLLPEPASSALAVGGLLGVVLLSLPDLVGGFLDQGVLLAGVTDDVGTVEALNVTSAIGGGVVILVVVGFLAVLVRAATGTADAADDPWEGHTLEWVTTSPPGPGNFTDLPVITSEAPVYDARHATEVGS
jgi:heme/copper-type cytochrome/quinol oxidase subunit 1